jgi:hypothetical protein
MDPHMAVLQVSFPGEPPDQHMKKLDRSNQRVTCGSCRQFDGHAWCRHWNFHTSSDSPICAFYRVRAAPTLPSPPSGEAS